MTIDDQLREIARHTERHQRVITADEVVQRASVHDVAFVAEPQSGDGSVSTPTSPSPDRSRERHRRGWYLVAAAAIVVVTLGIIAVNIGDSSETPRIAPVESSPERLPATTTADTVAPTTSAPPLSISPDGGSIAFAADPRAGEALTDPLGHGLVETRPQPMDIYVAREGEPIRRLVSTGAHERCPAFSPDGQRLAYLEASTEDPSIVVLRLDAAGQPTAELRIPLPASEMYELRANSQVACPQWSPDGSRLAYPASLGNRSGPTTAELRVATLDGEEHPVDTGAAAYTGGPFAWSPAGDALAYIALTDIWSAPVDGGSPRLVWRSDGSWATAVSWSSRGELAVTVRTTVDLGGGFSRDDLSLHIVDATTGNVQDIGTVADGGTMVNDGTASWSPDGTRLAHVDGDGYIVVTDRVLGSTARWPTGQPDGRDTHVSWSPDGERLLALGTSADRGYAFVSMSADGASAELITPWTWGFEWISPADVSWQPSTN